jgi:hypothetical protein
MCKFCRDSDYDEPQGMAGVYLFWIVVAVFALLSWIFG